MFYFTGELNGKNYNEELIPYSELKKGLIQKGHIKEDAFDDTKKNWVYNLNFTVKAGYANEPSANVPLVAQLTGKGGEQMVLRYTESAPLKDERGNLKYNRPKQRISTQLLTTQKELAFFLFLHPSQKTSPMKGEKVNDLFYLVEPEKEKAAKVAKVKEKHRLTQRIAEESENVIKAKFWAMGLAATEGQTAESMRDDLLVLVEQMGVETFLDKYDSPSNNITGTIMQAYHQNILTRNDSGNVRRLSWGDNASPNLRGQQICIIPAGIEPNSYILQHFIDHQESQFQTLLKQTVQKSTEESTKLINKKVEEAANEEFVADLKTTIGIVKYGIKEKFIFINLMDSKVYFKSKKDAANFIEMLSFDSALGESGTQELIAEHISKSQQGKKKDENISNLLDEIRKSASQSATQK